MPDLDIIERGLSPGWRKPYRLIAGEQPAPHVAKALLQAVALSLRRNGGVPGLIEIAETLARFNAGSLVVQELFRHFGGSLFTPQIWDLGSWEILRFRHSPTWSGVFGEKVDSVEGHALANGNPPACAEITPTLASAHREQP